MYYADIRELVRKSYFMIREEKKNQCLRALENLNFFEGDLKPDELDDPDD